jgi:hypothetical protein
MRLWQFWWRTLVLSAQYNPPQFVEHLMIVLMFALGARWILGFLGMLTDDWQYLVLSSSFALGAAISMLVRELIIPSPRSRWVVVVAVAVLLIYSFYAFADLVRYYF